MGSVAPSQPPFQVLVIGGSYAGLSATLNLIDLTTGQDPRCGREINHLPASQRVPVDVEITLVDERDGFLHLIGCPLALASDDFAAKAWAKYDDVTALQRPNIRVIQGSAKSVDTAAKTAVIARGEEETKLSYDFLVAASGLRRVWPVVPQSLSRKQYLLEAGAHIKAVTEARHGVLVVGGGAVGIEMAAELKLVHPSLKVTLAHSRDKLLSSEGLPDETKDVALDLLKESGVDVLMSHQLESQNEVEVDFVRPDGTSGSIKAIEAVFTNGHKLLVDNVIMAMSKSLPTTSYLPRETLDEEGYIKIQANLAFPADTPNAMSHFAAGDLASWSGIKRAGAAMHHGFYAASNIHQQMLQQRHGLQTATFNELGPVSPMIGLAVGKKAVSYGPEQGTEHGLDVMKAYFGNDLGFRICWNYMRLGGPDGMIKEE